MILSRQATVLLVDDHPSIRLILAAGLKAHGFHMLTAATAEKAPAYCEGFDGRIDILLSDIGLVSPEMWVTHAGHESIMHGVALVKRAVQTRPTMKIVLLTGHSNEYLQHLGFGRGETQGFLLLQKPCDLKNLVRPFQQF